MDLVSVFYCIIDNLILATFLRFIVHAKMARAIKANTT